MKKVKGSYKREMGFIYVYSNNTVYTISIYDGNWSCCKVGNRMLLGSNTDPRSIRPLGV